MTSHVLKIAICLSVLLSTGCAYVEYRRIYNVEPSISAEKRTAVGTVVERYFLDKGYVLKQKYHDYHPDDMYVSAFEIPRTTEQKVRHPYLSVLVKQTGIVQIKHSEWFLDTNPFGDSKHKPKDLIAAAREDLITRIKNQTGIVVDIQLFEKGYY